jgi:hypothetical protein
MNCLKYHIKNERHKEYLAWKERWDKMTPEERKREQEEGKEIMRKWTALMSFVPMVYRFQR